MKRPKQHIIEEESRKRFALLIPDEWVTNDFDKDYGKDISVEIFKNHESTGKIFICQLKGSSKVIFNDVMEIPIETNILRYYNTLQQQVLLVFYSTSNQKFWAIWANQLLYKYDLKSGQEKVTVKLGLKNLIDDVFFRKLETSFNDQIGNKINIIIHGNSIYLKIQKNKIIAWLAKYYSKHIEHENYFLPKNIEFEINDFEDTHHITIKTQYIRFELTPIQINENSKLLYKPIIEESNISPFEAEYLYLIASLFLLLDTKASLSLLGVIFAKYNGKYKTNESILEIARLAIEKNLINEYQNLVRLIIDSNSLKDFMFLNLALFAFDPSKQFKFLYRDNLILAISNFPDSESKASLCYNLANHYRANKHYYLASENYQLARKLNIDYLENYYWWNEYAGVLYETGHYSLAERFYEQSITRDKKADSLPLTYALKADTLFKQFKFSDSVNLLDKYFSEVRLLDKLPSLYYIFLNTVCENLILKGFENSTVNIYESSILENEGIITQDIYIIEKSIIYNPLNGNAWYNKGIFLNKAEQYNESYYCFLAASVILFYDKLSWINCLFLQHRQGTPELQTYLLATIVRIFGDTIINDITEKLIENTNMKVIEKQQLIEFYIKLLEIVKTKVFPMEYLPEAEVMRFY